MKSNPSYAPDSLFVQGYVAWADIGGKGRGLVALKDIPEGLVFERSPVLVVPSQVIEAAGDPLDCYVFRWGAERDGQADFYALATGGFAALCNHSFDPNACLVQDDGHRLIELKALRSVKKGEEITIDYDCELWFDPGS